MERPNVQADLFPASGTGDVNPVRKNRSFFSSFFGYEKVIIISIAFLLCAVVSFSFGVERGKRIARASGYLNLETASANPVPADMAVSAPAVETKPALPVQKASSINTPEKVVVKLPVTGNRLQEKDIGRYTIQVAAYKDRKNAQREAEVLRKSGLEVKLLVKGNYSVLYAGNFANREKAQMAMGKLEKKYKGCIIRRL